MYRSILWSSMALALIQSMSSLRADPQADVASFSAFPQANLEKLGSTSLDQARGSLMQYQRGISAQSLFILDAPINKVQERILNWDTSKHKELEVYVHGLLPVSPPPTPASFVGLKDLPENRSIAYLINYTTKLGPDFHELLVNTAEEQLWKSYAPRATDKASRRAAVVDYWCQVLSGRANLFLSGNYHSAAGNYDSAEDGKLNSFDEIKEMMRADPKVHRQFSNLLAETPFDGGTVGKPTGLYYECYDVQGEAAIGTGAIYTGKQADSVQILDAEYYENYGVYTVLELHQLWPITVNGQEKTLVWRADMVSAPSITALHGTERLASSMIMLQEVKQSVDVFRTEFK